MPPENYIYIIKKRVFLKSPEKNWSASMSLFQQWGRFPPALETPYYRKNLLHQQKPLSLVEQICMIQP